MQIKSKDVCSKLSYIHSGTCGNVHHYKESSSEFRGHRMLMNIPSTKEVGYGATPK
jgi:hypothetical protein